MKESDYLKYEEYLTTIVNTRFLYNTISDYESKLGLFSLHSNGVKRCLNSYNKIRSAFRDFQVETSLLTNNTIQLEEIILDYKLTWDFYSEFLSRRRNITNWCQDLLNFYYPPFKVNCISSVKLDLFSKVVSRNINVPLLLLFLLKVIPGYDSKEGDVDDINASFNKVLSLLTAFTYDTKRFNLLPSIRRAKQEINKTRLTLLYHTCNILDLYSAYEDSNELYRQSSYIKTMSVNLDIEGFWNQCGGSLNSTVFYQVENLLQDGAYSVTYWHKDATNILNGIRYTMFLSKYDITNLQAYIMHPQAIKAIINGKPYTEEDNVWYIFDNPQIERPTHISFSRLLYSNFWPANLSFTRVHDSKILNTYQRWLQKFEHKILYDNSDYVFTPCLYAITINSLYIHSADLKQFYKIPRTAYPGFEDIKLGDLVGLLTFQDKEYIYFDELLLCIQTTYEQLSKYKIEVVNTIV